MAEPLLKLFTSLSEAKKAQMRTGFKKLASIYPGHEREVVDVAVRTYTAAGDTSVSEVASTFAVSREDAVNVLVALAFVAGFFSTSRTETAQEFSEASVAGGIVENSDVPVLESLHSELGSKAVEIKSAAADESLSEAILPSLTSFTAVVDLRLGIGHDKIAQKVPVLLVRLETDIGAEYLVFQMGKAKLKSVIEQLRRALEQMAVAENWMKDRQ